MCLVLVKWGGVVVVGLLFIVVGRVCMKLLCLWWVLMSCFSISCL